MKVTRDEVLGWQSDDIPTPLTQLINGRVYHGLNRANVQLRVWLPEPAKVGLEQVCARAGKSLTAYLTEFIVIYMYGQHEFLRMQVEKIGLYEPLKSRSCAMTVEEPQPPNLGKNIFAMKIFIPGQIKKDLQNLANRADITLGEFSRDLICAHLFGREYWADKFRLWTKDEKRHADDWELEEG